MRCLACAAIAAVSLLAGCAVMVAGGSGSTVWRCEDGTRFSTTIAEDGATAWLARGGRTDTLRRVASASGATFSDGRTLFRRLGDQAILESGGVVHRGCRPAG